MTQGKYFYLKYVLSDPIFLSYIDEKSSHIPSNVFIYGLVATIKPKLLKIIINDIDLYIKQRPRPKNNIDKYLLKIEKYEES